MSWTWGTEYTHCDRKLHFSGGHVSGGTRRPGSLTNRLPSTASSDFGTQSWQRTQTAAQCVFLPPRGNSPSSPLYLKNFFFSCSIALSET